MTTRIGYAAGAYDLFHIGHLNLLRHARSQCDHLIAGVVSDELCHKRKGNLPVIPLRERIEIVRSIKYVDEAVVESRPDKMEMWQDLKFDVFFKGNDWQGTAKGRLLEQQFAAVGVEVVYFPYTVHTSSTMLRKTLALIIASPNTFNSVAGGQL
ncbi:adenylyltransferase/cytidyltransferase family protein [Arthrobacter sp. LAPM80]|uniref:adenylyltransferase/cytidyltransferase family protein n=1 Tax=Arthrobacter sp. LAPM80 TaxID=3141788 RepID=UPI00398B2225